MLATAADTQQVDMVRFWLDQGPEPNVVLLYADECPGNGSPIHAAIHLAIRWGNTEIIKLLLDHGVKMLKDSMGRTPFGKARYHNQEDAVKLLERHLREKALGLDHFDERTAAISYRP